LANRVQCGSPGVARQFARQFTQAGHSGKACREGAVPLLATQLVDITLTGDLIAMNQRITES